MQLEWSERGGEEWEVRSQREQGVRAQNLDFVPSENPTCSPGISWLCFRVGTYLPLLSLSLTNQEPPRAAVGALVLGPPDVELTLSKYLASSSWLPPPTDVAQHGDSQYSCVYRWCPSPLTGSWVGRSLRHGCRLWPKYLRRTAEWPQPFCSLSAGADPPPDLLRDQAQW